MSKRLRYIALMLCAAFTASAQVVAPVGVGLDHSVLEMTPFDGGMAAITVDADSQIEAHHWNGDFWYQLAEVPLPDYGTNTYGVLEIKDAKSIQGKLYVLAEHTFDITGFSPNYVLEWDGKEWTALEGGLLNNALQITELVEVDNTICLVGIFYDGTDHHNLLRWDGSDWGVEGNLITRNVGSDHFKSVIQVENKLYATGQFTHPSSGVMSMVELNNDVWQTATYPAFLTKNTLVSKFNGKLVVYGENSFDSDRIKLQSGNSWESLNTGLDGYTIEELKGLHDADNVLYATGRFTDANNTTYDLMAYQNGSWSAVPLNVSAIEQGHAVADQLFVYGDYTDGNRLKHIGVLESDFALITARVFHDRDGDCVKDQDEEWMQHYPLHLNDEIDFLTTDASGALYVRVGQDQYEINTTDYSYWTATCPDVDLNVNAYQAYDDLLLGVSKEANVTDLAIEAVDNQSYVYQNGERKQVMVCVRNPGSNSVQGATITLTHAADLSAFQSERAYDSYADNTATWTVDLDAEESLCFYVSFELQGSDMVEVDVEVTIEGDRQSGNNQTQLRYKTGETLVNDKHCNNGESIAQDEEFMNYKIGFKNNGTGDAVDIMIVDELDESIVPSAQGLHYTYSHTCTSLPTEYRILENGNWQYKYLWEFRDINLPNVEGAESEGFLDFKVYLEPNTLDQGDEICNMAKIYYSYRKGSYNEAIHTNTVCSQVDALNGEGDDIPAQVLSASPVPATNSLFIRNNTGNEVRLRITNALGQEITEMQLHEYGETTIDVQDLATGAYMLYADGRFVQKLLIH